MWVPVLKKVRWLRFADDYQELRLVGPTPYLQI